MRWTLQIISMVLLCVDDSKDCKAIEHAERVGGKKDWTEFGEKYDGMSSLVTHEM